MEECDESAARDGYQQDNVHKEVMQDIKRLQDGFDITSGKDVHREEEEANKHQVNTQSRQRRKLQRRKQ